MGFDSNGQHPKKAVLEFYRDFPQNDPFLQSLGARILAVGAGELKLELDISGGHLNVHGIAHGGVSTTLLDTAMGGACYTLSKGVVSLAASLEFISAVPNGRKIIAVGRVIHNGRRTMATEGEVIDADSGKLYLKGQATFFVVKDYNEEDDSKAI